MDKETTNEKKNRLLRSIEILELNKRLAIIDLEKKKATAPLELLEAQIADSIIGSDSSMTGLSKRIIGWDLDHLQDSVESLENMIRANKDSLAKLQESME